MVEVVRLEAAIPGELLSWAIGTFHATMLLLTLLGAAVVVVGLGGPFPVLSSAGATLALVLLGGYAWVVVWWTTGEWLDSIDRGMLGGPSSENTVVAGAVLWGGATGLLLFVPSFGLGLLFIAASTGGGTFPLLVITAAIGAAVAAGAGAVLWGVLAVIDLFLLNAARAWLPDVDPGPDR